MIDQEINLKVAEKLGWKMLEGPVASGFERSQRYVVNETHHRRIWIHENQRMACEECGNFPDFINETAWTVKLLKRIIKEHTHIVFEPVSSRSEGVMLTPYTLSRQPVRTSAESVDRAVALAFINDAPSLSVANKMVNYVRECLSSNSLGNDE